MLGLSADLWATVKADIKNKFDTLTDRRTVMDMEGGYAVTQRGAEDDEESEVTPRKILYIRPGPFNPGDDVVTLKTAGGEIILGVLSKPDEELDQGEGELPIPYQEVGTSIAIGPATEIGATGALAIGRGAKATALRSTAIGMNANANLSDTTEIRANSLRVVRSSGTGQTWILISSPNGVLHQLSIFNDGEVMWDGIPASQAHGVWGVIRTNATAASGANWSWRNGPGTTGTYVIGSLVPGSTRVHRSSWTIVRDGYTWHYGWANGLGWGWCISTAFVMD